MSSNNRQMSSKLEMTPWQNQTWRSIQYAQENFLEQLA